MATPSAASGDRVASWLALAAALAMPLVPGVARAAPAAPTILLELGGDADQAPPAPAEVRARVLFLNGISHAQRAALTRALDRVAAALEKRRNPLYAPLDEEDVRAEVQNVLDLSRPALTAAAALAAGRWRSGDGDLTARAVARCAPGAPCRALGPGAPDDSLQRRLRFLVWPVGHAIIVRAGGVPALQTAELLRSGQPHQSTVALVLSAPELHAPGRAADLKTLTRAAARVLALAKGAPPQFRALLSEIANTPSPSDEVPWLRLPPDAVLIVPRLAALAMPDAFLAEVRACLAGHAASVEWAAGR